MANPLPYSIDQREAELASPEAMRQAALTSIASRLPLQGSQAFSKGHVDVSIRNGSGTIRALVNMHSIRLHVTRTAGGQSPDQTESESGETLQFQTEYKDTEIYAYDGAKWSLQERKHLRPANGESVDGDCIFTPQLLEKIALALNPATVSKERLTHRVALVREELQQALQW